MVEETKARLDAESCDTDARATFSYCCECGTYDAHTTTCNCCGFDFRDIGTREADGT